MGRKKMETDGIPTLFTAYDAVAITPSDSTVFTEYTRAIYCGGDGTVTVRMESGNNCVFTVVTGLVLPVRVDKVLSTGTSATNLVALY